MKRQAMILAAVAVMSLATLCAWAQALGGGAAGDAKDAAAPATMPAGDNDKKDATEAKDTTSSQDDMASLEGKTPEEIREMVKKATESRLSAERQQVVSEMGNNVMWFPEQKEPAIKELQDKPLNTQKDNIDRICKAYAKVDEHFAKAYKLYADKKYTEAAEAFKKMSNTKEVSYFGAAKGYLLGDSLYRSGVAMMDAAAGDVKKEFDGRKQAWAAVDAYRDMLDTMPDRVSFSASAALNCAEVYERLGRGIYAMDMYGFCVKNFALTLDKEQVLAISEKVTKLEEVYKDPMLSVAKMMGDVKGRLEKVDSGKDTQKAEQQIVSVLEDLIKTTEEKQQQQPKPDPKKAKKPGEGEPKPGEGQGEPKPGGKSGQKPSGANRPSSPAKVSALPDGGAGRTPKGTEIRAGNEKGDWAELAPREKERLMDAARKAIPERNRDIIRDYFLRMAEERSAENK